MQKAIMSPYQAKSQPRSQSTDKHVRAKSNLKLTSNRSDPKINNQRRTPSLGVVGTASAFKPRGSLPARDTLELKSHQKISECINESLLSIEEVTNDVKVSEFDQDLQVVDMEYSEDFLLPSNNCPVLLPKSDQQIDNEQRPINFETSIVRSQPTPSLVVEPSEFETATNSDRLETKQREITECEIDPSIAVTSVAMPEIDNIFLTEFYKTGYLTLKTQGIFTGWQKQYFEIEPFKIYYNQSKEIVEAKKDIKCINLRVTRCEIIEDHKNSEFSIATEEQSLVLRLKGNSKEETAEWIRFFTKLFDFVKMTYPAVNHQYSFNPENLFKNDFMVEEELLANVETGDLLLLKSKHIGAKFQRIFTSSEYDHCALFVKALGDVYLYDSVYGEGVQLTSWEDFKLNNPHLNYTTLAFRKLNIPGWNLKNKIQHKIWQFVTTHIGKKYELNVWKLFKKASFYKDDDDDGNMMKQMVMNAQDHSLMDNVIGGNNNISLVSKQPAMEYRNNDEGFFCSELLAAAYKFTGLLDGTISSSRYLPVSFSQKKELTMRKGVVLSQEYNIALLTRSIPNQAQ